MGRKGSAKREEVGQEAHRHKVVTAYQARVRLGELRCEGAKKNMERIKRVFARFGIEAAMTVHGRPRDATAGKSELRFEDPESLGALAALLERAAR